MRQYVIDNILNSINNFEKHVNCSISDRFWALTVFADLQNSSEEVTVEKNNNIPSASFINEFKKITNIIPTNDEWQSWLSLNSPILNKLPWDHWESYDNRAMFCVGDFFRDTSGHGTVFCLTTDANPPTPDFDVSSSSIVKGFGTIPQMWLQLGAQIEEPIPPSIAHEEWLSKGLKSIFKAKQDTVNEFILNNKQSIDKLRKSFKTTSPTYIGGGADGVAFDIGNNRVLKIFKDGFSYTQALSALDRLHKNPDLAKTEAMLYDVGIMGSIHSQDLDYPVYYYIMEKMTPIKEFFPDRDSNPLPQILYAITKSITSDKAAKWSHLKKEIDNPIKSSEIKQKVKEEAVKLADQIRNDPANHININLFETIIPGLKSNWLELYVEEVILKYLTSRTDLWMGNLGITNYGELRYFDPSISYYHSDINVFNR